MTSKTTAPATAAKTTTGKVATAKQVVAKATGRKPAVVTQTCRTCGITKPLSGFRNKASRPLGVDTNCRDCSILWLANRKIARAAEAKAATSKRAASKPVVKATSKPVAKTTRKPAAKPVATPATMPAREAAARARDARKTAVAK